ncbi:MAG TPA: siroheme synthase CysG, partial [Thiolinea sp.]|nr:siroheme synthase CysG [Thiolinea sp.]
MQHYPVFLDLKGKCCLVAGGGGVARRKTETLLQAGAHVRVVSPALNAGLQALQGSHPDQLTLIQRPFQAEDLERCALVFAATNARMVNQQIARLAQARNIPVNVADSRSESSFILPSIVDRSPVTIAVSTGGASPVLARQLRARLETLVPASCGQLAAITEEYREQVRNRLPGPGARHQFWEQLLRGPFAELVYAGNVEAARALLDQQLQAPADTRPVGEVYLVGAGPGDPDLLTFRAWRLMQQADVVVYDRLVARSILDQANRSAERLYVGKEKANHAVPQDRINELLVELARQGRRVLRLKGGDPFIFGRGGEEIETLAENG